MVIIIVIRTIPVIFSISEILIENLLAGIDTQKSKKSLVFSNFHLKRAVVNH